MRIWSVHPRFLDRQALIAGWRETLLAQKVLDGGTKGYKHHPQLDRWRETPEPLVSIGSYLWGLREEATARGYQFDAGRILFPPADPRALDASMPLSTGQLDLEWHHLETKVQARSPEVYARWFAPGVEQEAAPHPMFRLFEGPRASWERN